jgi:type II secretory pathway component PulF
VGNQPLGPFNLILLAPPALALVLAMRVLFGRSRQAATDPMYVLLSISSVTMFILAVVGALVGLVGAWVLFLPLPIAAIILALMVLDRTRRSENRGLVWALATAATRGIPLPEAARAYADETGGRTGARALRLAENLERGQSLAVAARGARLRMGTAMRMTVGLSEPLGMLGPAMRQQIDDSQHLDNTLRDTIGRFFYLGAIGLVLSCVCTFVMLKIVPVFERMFDEFGVGLPGLTRLVISISAQDEYWGLLGLAAFVAMLIVHLIIVSAAMWKLLNYLNPVDPRMSPSEITLRRALRGLLIVYAVLALLPCAMPITILLPPILYYVGWFPRDLPVIWRLFRRYDGALVMRGLAQGIRRGMPLPQAMRMVEAHYPVSIIRGRLHVAAEQIDAGHDWRDSLRDAGLITQADAAVLAAAQRVGNLDWALEEMAASALRRQTLRIQAVHSVVFPILMLFLGLVVFVFICGLFMPLVRLIEGLV